MGDAQLNELWVNLSALGDGNIFGILPQLMQKMVESETVTNREQNDPLDEIYDLILPSDNSWQTKIYYKLVERQRIADSGDNDDMQTWLQSEPEEKLHDWLIQPKSLQCDKLRVERKRAQRPSGPGPITWTVADIAKAACLLTNPPIQTQFEDEQEMRRVYTLIYDVFRYKNILSVALTDIQFFQHYPDCETVKPHVWLLFYDLYHRSFKKRESSVIDLVVELFNATNLSTIESALWQKRTRLAAAVSRLRIQNSALSLNDLLPAHLKDGKVSGACSKAIFSAWFNTKKIKNFDKLKTKLESTFQLRHVDDINKLGPNCYKIDKHCPQVLTFHGSLRTDLAKSEFVKNFKLVVQDKSFCLGPATFLKQLDTLELKGSVIQTHINSPRTTAYLANVLNQNDKIKKLMAFSAGTRKPEYESYFSQLGLTNVTIFADRLIDINPDSQYMEEVVAVFATPPNSYSAVSDPIDLVCSRGGDLSMLEVLTESEESEEGAARVYSILDEQKRTLKFAMSRPQIQFVLYETHSELNAENDGMVHKTMSEVNRLAKMQHLIIPQGKGAQSGISIVQDVMSQEINNNDGEKEMVGSLEIRSNETISTIEYAEEKSIQNLLIPETDYFDQPKVPSLCCGEDPCVNLVKEGCYLALLQRKQIIKLDNKYMIQMAENRGLFGQKSSSSIRLKGSKATKKKVDKPSSSNTKPKRRIKETEIIRIATPTHTFLRHTQQDGHEMKQCSRCKLLLERSKTEPPVYRKWWTDTTRHIINLRTNLIKTKVIPAPVKKSSKQDVTKAVDYMVAKSVKIDELVAKSRGPSETNIPIFPKLKLMRDYPKKAKEVIVLPVTDVYLPTRD